MLSLCVGPFWAHLGPILGSLGPSVALLGGQAYFRFGKFDLGVQGIPCNSRALRDFRSLLGLRSAPGALQRSRGFGGSGFLCDTLRGAAASMAEQQQAAELTDLRERTSNLEGIVSRLVERLSIVETEFESLTGQWEVFPETVAPWTPRGSPPSSPSEHDEQMLRVDASTASASSAAEAARADASAAAAGAAASAAAGAARADASAAAAGAAASAACLFACTVCFLLACCGICSIAQHTARERKKT